MPIFHRSNPNPVDPAGTPPKKLTKRERRAIEGIERAKGLAASQNAKRGTGKSTRSKWGRKTGEPRYGQPIGPDTMTPCSKGAKRGQPGCGRAEGRPHITSICGRKGKVKDGNK